MIEHSLSIIFIKLLGLTIPYCNEITAKNCLTKDRANGALEMYNIVQPLLESQAIRCQCDGIEKFYLTDEDIMSHIKFNYKSLEEWEIANDIDGLSILAIENNALGVSVLLSALGHFSLDQTQSSVVNSLAEYDRLRQDNFQRAFVQLSPNLPWGCYFLLKLTSLMKSLAIILAIASTFSLLRLAFKWYKYSKAKQHEEVINLVESILDVFRDSSDEEYLVVNHVRDMIIPLNQRKKMETCWTKAVKFINENESRIRTEVQVVQGEQYEVWRWLGNKNVSFNASGGKSWQGQAFETLAGSPNSAPRSATSCLKIRGMLDGESKDVNAIKDAILSKCGEQCNVLHFAIESSTKCIYLKCASKADASMAYKNLHGWWYCGRLVTVKYLREQRYSERFPDSPKTGPAYLRATTYAN